MNLSPQGLLSRPSSTPHSQKRDPIAGHSTQHRAMFFELDYLFAQPRIDWFSRASRRRKQHERTKIDSKTINLSLGDGSPKRGKNFTHTIDFKDCRKKIDRVSLETGGALHIGDRGEAIHSMKYDSRIRTISSLNDHKNSDAAFKQEARIRIRQRLPEGEKASQRLGQSQCPVFTVSAQGVNYSERAMTGQRPRQRGKQLQQRGKQPVIRGKLSISTKGNGSQMKVGVKQGRTCRPWSPVHRSGPHVGLDELLTLQ